LTKKHIIQVLHNQYKYGRISRKLRKASLDKKRHENRGKSPQLKAQRRNSQTDSRTIQDPEAKKNPRMATGTRNRRDSRLRKQRGKKEYVETRHIICPQARRKTRELLTGVSLGNQTGVPYASSLKGMDTPKGMLAKRASWPNKI